MLSRGEPVKAVSERLGHTSPTVTLSVYAHVLSGDQRAAAARFAALIGLRKHDRTPAGIS